MSDVVTFEHTPKGFTIHTNHPLLGDIRANFASVSPERRQGTARALLVAAALDCFCGTLNAALLSRDVQYRSIKGAAYAETEKRSGVSYVTRINISVQVDAEIADSQTLAHCLSIVKGCLITRSLMEGIEVTIHASQTES